MTNKHKKYLYFVNAYIRENGDVNPYCRVFIEDVCWYLLVDRIKDIHDVMVTYKTRKQRSYGDVKLNLLETDLYNYMYLYDAGKKGRPDDDWLEEELSNGMTKHEIMQTVLEKIFEDY